MTYQLPNPYKCVKCDHEFEYSPHHTHPAPVLSKQIETDRGIWNQHMPVCPRCWGDFLLKNIGIGYNTHKWKPEGSDYEIEKGKNT
jgi:DNA-directed RNA polymerase subunit RPC12/RpoP